MSADKQRFTVRASASRLNKGFLAVPQRFKAWFPSDKTRIQIVFDDEDQLRTVTFHPYDSVTKETRIFGLANWYTKRGVREGDLLSVTVEDAAAAIYRIALDRYVRQRQEQRARQDLLNAVNDARAEAELQRLSHLVRKRPREVAQEELLRMSRESARQPRPVVVARPIERRESVPAAVRILLRELHEGKCQLCSFTFEKRDGQPYFEIHHIDARIGHHPSNLLVVCANCHAQLEQAMVSDHKWMGEWLVGVSINGEAISVRQPLAHDSIRRTLISLILAATAANLRRLIYRRPV